MTKKDHQKFWQIKIDFLGRKCLLLDILEHVAEIGECFIGSGGWTPLDYAVWHQ